MKTTAEVWLETVKDALARGETAVLAVSKANIVTNSYAMRFVPDKVQVPEISMEAAKGHFEELIKMGDQIPLQRYQPEDDVKERAEKYEKPELPIPASGPLATELGEV